MNYLIGGVIGFILMGGILINSEIRESRVKPHVAPVETVKIKVVTFTCTEVKAGECRVYELRESYLD
jgi:hypothetical protein